MLTRSQFVKQSKRWSGLEVASSPSQVILLKRLPQDGDLLICLMLRPALLSSCPQNHLKKIGLCFSFSVSH